MPRDEFDDDYRPLRGHAETAHARPGTRSEAVTWPWVLLAAVGVLALCGLVGWLAVGAVDSARRRDAEAERLSQGEVQGGPVYTRVEFERLVLGKSVEEVRAAVGRPSQEQGGSSFLAATYRGRTLDPKTGQPDSQAVVQFRDNKAVRVVYT